MSGSEQVSVYDTVALPQAASVKDIVIADSGTAFLLTDDAVCIFACKVLC